MAKSASAIRRAQRRLVDCSAGEEYLIRRPGKPALVVRIVEVRLNFRRGYANPRAFYVALTRTGAVRRKGRRYEPPRAVAQLTWRDGRWQFPHGERVNG